jgi:hypothetical protein
LRAVGGAEPRSFKTSLTSDYDNFDDGDPSIGSQPYPDQFQTIVQRPCAQRMAIEIPSLGDKPEWQ